mmetsp:Transcript_14600/g.25473  ORF Transcript_14600/g.25473 Transcript_14600/m.25473 type:complete len:268 (-) Transcript_14600:168-971(-)
MSEASRLSRSCSYSRVSVLFRKSTLSKYPAPLRLCASISSSSVESPALSCCQSALVLSSTFTFFFFSRSAKKASSPDFAGGCKGRSAARCASLLCWSTVVVTWMSFPAKRRVSVTLTRPCFFSDKASRAAASAAPAAALAASLICGLLGPATASGVGTVTPVTLASICMGRASPVAAPCPCCCTWLGSTGAAVAAFPTALAAPGSCKMTEVLGEAAARLAGGAMPKERIHNMSVLSTFRCLGSTDLHRAARLIALPGPWASVDAFPL